MSPSKIKAGAVYRSVTGWLRRVESIAEDGGQRFVHYRNRPPGGTEWSAEAQQARLDLFANLCDEEVEVPA